jgi:hypothetical protein
VRVHDVVRAVGEGARERRAERRRDGDAGAGEVGDAEPHDAHVRVAGRGRDQVGRVPGRAQPRREIGEMQLDPTAPRRREVGDEGDAQGTLSPR